MEGLRTMKGHQMTQSNVTVSRAHKIAERLKEKSQ